MYRFKREDGVQGGLIIWAVFIVVFALLGVPAPLAILLGGFGGVAVMQIQIYWRAEEDEAAVEQPEEENPIRPIRRLIDRLPFRGLLGLGRSPTRRITGDSATGEGASGRESDSRRDSPIRARRPSSSFRDAVRRRKEGS